MGEASLDPETDDLLRREVERLADEFRGMFSRETIDRCARESVGWLTGARIKRYLPIFAYRFTRERLLALAGVEGLRPVDRPHILFVCVRNAARSQIAAALAQHLSGGAIEAHSAGSAPAKQIDPAAVEVMRELGVDLSQEFPKPLADEVVRAADLVVTMGCGDACPLHPFKKYEDWSIEDPAGQPLEKVREIRDAIRAHVERLLAELGVLSAR